MHLWNNMTAIRTFRCRTFCAQWLCSLPSKLFENYCMLCSPLTAWTALIMKKMQRDISCFGVWHILLRCCQAHFETMPYHSVWCILQEIHVLHESCESFIVNMFILVLRVIAWKVRVYIGMALWRHFKYSARKTCCGNTTVCSYLWHPWRSIKNHLYLRVIWSYYRNVSFHPMTPFIYSFTRFILYWHLLVHFGVLQRRNWEISICFSFRCGISDSFPANCINGNFSAVSDQTALQQAASSDCPDYDEWCILYRHQTFWKVRNYLNRQNEFLLPIV